MKSNGRRALGAAMAVAIVASVFVSAGPAAAASSTWTNVASSGPGGSVGPTLAYDKATGTDVLFTTTGQTWTWNGSAWSQQNPATSPPARQFASMGYDEVHHTVLLFGGQTSSATLLSDTWTWDGTNWAQQHPMLSPPARHGASIAFDSGVPGTNAGRLTLFGGYGGFPGIFYGDTWAWDGANWNELVANFVTAGAGPPPRAGAQMAANEANKTIVLFGGTNYAGELADTWVWSDGPTGHWTRATPQVSPSARVGGAMAFSPASNPAPTGHGGLVVLFGGGCCSSNLVPRQDTWTWDGDNWAQAAPAGQPAARVYSAMATAPGGEALLFGGQGSLTDTWTWSGSPTPSAVAPTVVSCPAAPGPSGSTYALPVTSGPDTLRGAAAVSHPGLYIGSSLVASELYDTNPLEQTTSASQFNMITSSNQMYWSADNPEPHVYDFCHGDQFVGYAQAYHQSLRFHNLLAGGAVQSQNPKWVTSRTDWTAASLAAAMREHIMTTMAHYKGKVAVWDVANEALAGAVPADNVFKDVIGYPGYVELAFQYAHEADPNATLLYDDYLDWRQPKQDAMFNLLSDLKSKGIHVDAVGFELFSAGPGMVTEDLKGAMSRFASQLGLKTAITQMSVPFTGVSPPGTAEPDTYRWAVSACLDPASNCFMFHTWGLSDTYSLPTAAFADPTYLLKPSPPLVPLHGGALFDELYRPRPAFTTVLNALR